MILFFLNISGHKVAIKKVSSSISPYHHSHNHYTTIIIPRPSYHDDHNLYHHHHHHHHYHHCTMIIIIPRSLSHTSPLSSLSYIGERCVCGCGGREAHPPGDKTTQSFRQTWEHHYCVWLNVSEVQQHHYHSYYFIIINNDNTLSNVCISWQTPIVASYVLLTPTVRNFTDCR